MVDATYRSFLPPAVILRSAPDWQVVHQATVEVAEYHGWQKYTMVGAKRCSFLPPAVILRSATDRQIVHQATVDLAVRSGCFSALVTVTALKCLLRTYTRTRPVSRSSIRPRLTWQSLSSVASSARMRASWASRAAAMRSLSVTFGHGILNARN